MDISAIAHEAKLARRLEHPITDGETLPCRRQRFQAHLRDLGGPALDDGGGSASSLPLSTTSTSHWNGREVRYPTSFSNVGPMRRSSLYAGTITDRNGFANSCPSCRIVNPLARLACGLQRPCDVNVGDKNTHHQGRRDRRGFEYNSSNLEVLIPSPIVGEG